MTAPLRVYRLTLTPPPQAADPAWIPPGWEKFWADRFGQEPYEYPPFRLPGRRHFFSRAAAETWARRMRGWGCAAVVEPSDPITWPAGKTP